MKRDCLGGFLAWATCAFFSRASAPPSLETLGRGLCALACVGVMSQLSSPAAAQMAAGGEFGVSSTGAAIYAIPLAVPPGTAGLAPSLSLDYNSQNGDGALGVGWSLGVTQAISRCPQTVAQDGVHGSLNNNGNDRFCLGGQRLVVTSGGYGADGAEYRTEIDSFSRIVSHGASGNGPAWFEVRTKAGRVMEFGRTADAFIATGPGSQTARLWALDKVSDTKGNSYTVSYTSQPGVGQAFVSRIDYTGNAAAGLAPYASAQFSYETRPDVRPAYIAGSLIQTARRLNRIQTFLGSALVGDYRLAYQQGGATGRSRLASLTPCGGDGSCLPATTFGWTDGNGRSDLLKTITTGLTKATSITYAPLTASGVHARDASAVYPIRDWQGPMFVVSRVDVSNGVGGVDSSTYRYAGARIDLSGRGFLPFRQTVVTDAQTNVAQTTNYRQDYPFIGLVASQTTVLGAQTLSETLSDYQFGDAHGAANVGAPSVAGAPYNVSLRQNVASSFDLDGATRQATRTSFQFDAFGNPTQIVATSWDGFVKTTTNAYANDAASWLLGRLTSASVTSQAPDAAAPPPQAPAADLAVTKTHDRALGQGDGGIVYTIAVSNAGAWPTVGTVSVVDVLPAGLSASAIAGDGWSCTLATLTCTRGDPLAGGASYPSISVIVDVAVNAPPSVTNVATVSGGGDANAANNTASDTSAVTQAVRISASANNINLWDYLVANGFAVAGRPGAWFVTIDSGVVIGSASTGAYALDTGAFPAGSALHITNNGTITGAGGRGADGGNCNGAPATAGGPGLNVRFPVAILNNGGIWGGGGGGGGGPPLQIVRGGSGGGGGAGAVPGAGGNPSGSPGTLSAGGSGGGGVSPGWPGGAPGQAGVSSGGATWGMCGAGGAGGAGGAAGASVVGNSFVTWLKSGDVRGPAQPAPLTDLTILAWHALDFSQGQAGAAYKLTVSNVGAWAASGTVTVADTLPSGVTARSIAGDGWSCALATLSCTRGDALASGASYQTITLTVDVAANAATSVTNVATVSGGGDANAANNSSSDPTAITPTAAPPTAVTLSASMNNLDLWSYLVAHGYATAGQAGKWVVTVNSGVVIGSASTAAYAFDTGVFPSGSTLQIINNGMIVGAGGNGGVGQLGCDVTAAAGGAGGPALRVQSPVTIGNNGGIWGGGGGGAGYPPPNALSRSFYGGGGGAGSVAGVGGTPYGSAGTLTAGGQGGFAGTTTNGGGPGQPGHYPTYNNLLSICGLGGSAGAAVTGNSLVTWGSAGDVRGPLN